MSLKQFGIFLGCNGYLGCDAAMSVLFKSHAYLVHLSYSVGLYHSWGLLGAHKP